MYGKVLKISLALEREARNGCLDHPVEFEHYNLLLFFICEVVDQGAFGCYHIAGINEQWAFGKNRFTAFGVKFGEESLSHVGRVPEFVQDAGRFGNAGGVAWSIEHFRFCRSLHHPFALDLVVRNGLRYGGDEQHVLVELGESVIKLLTSDIAFGVVTLWKTYNRQ